MPGASLGLHPIAGIAASDRDHLRPRQNRGRDRQRVPVEQIDHLRHRSGSRRDPRRRRGQAAGSASSASAGGANPSARSARSWRPRRVPEARGRCAHARGRLMARPAWPAPMTITVVLAGTHLRPRSVHSTVTLVGFVTMSNTAERFCDWATSALMSSAVGVGVDLVLHRTPSKPLRASLSMPRMPVAGPCRPRRRLDRAELDAAVLATEAMPAVRQPARPASTISTGVGPCRGAANTSGWSVSR